MLKAAEAMDLDKCEMKEKERTQMLKKIVALVCVLVLLCVGSACAESVQARLNRKIATRTGPGTKYFEPGTFLGPGDYVTVHTKVWDDVNEIWWVQVEFTEYGDTYRAYTGSHRMDVNLSRVPEESPLATITVTQDADVFAGPGWDYVMWNDTVYRGTTATLLEVENGYGHIECWNGNWNQMWRVWAPLDCLSCDGWYSQYDDGWYNQYDDGWYSQYDDAYPAHGHFY